MIKTRDELDEKDTWDLASIFKDQEAWDKAFDECVTYAEPPHWPEIYTYRGRLHECIENLHKSFQLAHKVEGVLYQLYTWAYLKHDEDLSNPQSKIAFDKINNLYNAFKHENTWIINELFTLPDDLLELYGRDPTLKSYGFFFENVIYLKQHRLTLDEERLMVLLRQPLMGFYNAFKVLCDFDLKYDDIKDSNGREHELTNANLSNYIYSEDRELRKNAFLETYQKFYESRHLIKELYCGVINTHISESKARNYSSSLIAALRPNKIPEKVYRILIHTVQENISTLHRYSRLKKEILGYKEFYPWDSYAPVHPKSQLSITYSEAETAIINSVESLGHKYQEDLRKGLQEDRWVDKFPSKNKKSAAYSSGCYGTKPFILLNFQGQMLDAFTLAHELGHSMHSFYSWKKQPLQYSLYTNFGAEVASTFNEELLFRYLLEKFDDPEKKIEIIFYKLEQIKATFFRQVMLAEFELLTHEQVEQKGSISVDQINDLYFQLAKRYHGPDMTLHPLIQMEWSRVPHFYFNFYVNQYATGISCAHSLVDLVENGGELDRERYLQFLESGGNNFPIVQLKNAGVDMSKPEPTLKVIQRFNYLIDTLEELLPLRAASQIKI